MKQKFKPLKGQLHGQYYGARWMEFNKKKRARLWSMAKHLNEDCQITSWEVWT